MKLMTNKIDLKNLGVNQNKVIMSIHKELSYDQKIERVKGIQFSVLSPNEIVRDQSSKLRKQILMLEMSLYLGVYLILEWVF